MPKTHQLTWDKARKRWKKKYQGRQFYFAFGENKTDPDGYRQAVAAWEAKKVELDSVVENEQKSLDEAGWSSIGSFARPNINQMRRMVEQFDGISTKPQPRVKTIGECLDEFKILINAKLAAGQIKQVTRNGLITGIGTIGRILERERPVTSLTTPRLIEIYTRLLKEMGEGERGDRSVGSLKGLINRFAIWCATAEYIPLPTILITKSREYSVKKRQKAIITFEKSEITRLIENASERTQLYLLLCLNVGMYQADIAELAQSEVDWKNGFITRKRSKEETAPVITWKLWPRTFELLKKFRSNHPTFVLVNENGDPLRVFADDDGNAKNKDNVRSAYERLCRKLQFKGKTLKHLRKTSSTILGTQKSYRPFCQHFLDHTPETVADQVYVKPSQKIFNEAVMWLGRQFKIVA